MKEKNNKYHIKISAKFLLGIDIMKKLDHLKWIYVYIKLKYNYYLQHKPNECFELDVNDMSEFFHIHKTTVYDCLKWLTKYKLLVKEGRGKYKIISEKRFIESVKKNDNEDPNSKDSFLIIYNNEFMDLWDAGVKAKEALLYYYLIHKNKHQSKDEEWLEVNVSQTQTCKDLGIDHRSFKGAVTHLISIGYLKKDGKGPLCTKAPKPVELLTKEAPIQTVPTENTNENTETTFNDGWEFFDETSIDSKLKLNPELGSIEKKRKLLEFVKHPVEEWKLYKMKDGEYVFPVVRDPRHKEYFYNTENRISVDKCAAYGVDIDKCVRFGYERKN